MNILLTGASKGLGLMILKVLLEDGHSVYTLSRSSSVGLKELITKYPQRIKWLKFDLGNFENLRKIIFRDWIGYNTKIHGLVNNAAMAYDDIVTNLNYDLLQKMYCVNVFAPMLLTKYSLRQMLLHKIGGSIIHLSSVSVHTGYKGLSMYASTKGALEAFSKNTAREWGVKGIRSNCLVAGFMETDMSSTLSLSQKNRIYNRTSMKKPVDVNSVADTIKFLLSDESKSITGQNICVDNGTI